MKSAIHRRRFLQGGAALSAAGFVQINPEFFISTARAQTGRAMTYLAAENITGNWDPTSHSNLTHMHIEHLVMGYLTRTPMTIEKPDEVIYELATDITLLEPTRLQIKLREGVIFHDGKPFDAQDVKATFLYATQPDRPAQWFPGPDDTLDIETPDDYTVIIDTSRAGYPAHLFTFLSAFQPMMSARDIAEGSSGILTQRLNGTGPFVFKEQRGNDTILEAYDAYYLGKPTIPGINFSFVADSTTRMLSLMNGQASIVERLEPEQVDSLQGNEAIHINKIVSVENKYIWFRCSKPPFNDPRIRLAACHAIDRDLVLEIMGSAGHKSANFISPIKFGYTDLENYPQYDPDKCQALLAEAGFPGGQGLPPLEYIVSVGFYPKTKEYGEVITAMLNEQGFNVSLTTLEPASWNDQLYDRPGGGPGHMIDCGWSTMSPEPDLVLRTHFHSSSKRICGLEDAQVDASLDKERSAPSIEERRTILENETLPLLASKMPALSLFTSVMIHAMQKDFADLYIYPDGSVNVDNYI